MKRRSDPCLRWTMTRMGTWSCSPPERPGSPQGSAGPPVSRATRATNTPRGHGNALLRHDGAALQHRVHQVDRDAGLAVAAPKCPEEGVGSAIVGQQRGVDVEAAETWEGQQRGREAAIEAGDAERVRREA